MQTGLGETLVEADVTTDDLPLREQFTVPEGFEHDVADCHIGDLEGARRLPADRGRFPG
jgi:hypothetical protein